MIIDDDVGWDSPTRSRSDTVRSIHSLTAFCIALKPRALPFGDALPFQFRLRIRFEFKVEFAVNDDAEGLST